MRPLRFLLIAAAAVLVVAVALVPAPAGDCRVIQAPPAGSTYYFPSSYVGANTYFEEKVHVKELLVPILQPLPFFIDPRISYIYNGGNAVGVPLVPGDRPQAARPQASKPQPKSEDSLDLDGLIDRIEKRVRERAAEQVEEPADGPPPVPGFHKVAAASPRSGNARQVLSARCASCHTGDKSKGDFVIFARAGQLSPEFDRAAAWDAIDSDRMPPRPKPPVAEEDREVLRKEWNF